MDLVAAPENTAAQHTSFRFTLSGAEVERLRLTLPRLLRALADRPTASSGQRERRREAHAALESLLSTLSNQLQPAADGQEG